MLTTDPTLGGTLNIELNKVSVLQNFTFLWWETENKQI